MSDAEKTHLLWPELTAYMNCSHVAIIRQIRLYGFPPPRYTAINKRRRAYWLKSEVDQWRAAQEAS